MIIRGNGQSDKIQSQITITLERMYLLVNADEVFQGCPKILIFTMKTGRRSSCKTGVFEIKNTTYSMNKRILNVI